MATLQQLEQAFIQADDAGETEDAAAFAAEIVRLRGPQEQNAQDFVPAETTPEMEALGVRPEDLPTGKSLGQNIMSGAAKGMAETLGFPGEAMAAGLRGVSDVVSGGERSDAATPAGYLYRAAPTDTLKGLLNSIGLDTNPDPGFAGDAAQAIAGGLTGLGAASRASGVFKAGTEKLMQGRLGRFAAEDIAASAGGAGAKQLGDGEGERNVLELAGNVLTGYGINKFTGPVTAWRAGQAAYQKQQGQGFNQATEIVKGNVLAAGEDPTQIVNTLRSNQGLGADQMTTGAASNSVALQSLERGLLNVSGNAKYADEHIKHGNTFNQFVRDSIRQKLGGDDVPDAFVDAYRESVEYASDMAEKALQAATTKATREIQQLPPIEGMDYGTEFRMRLKETYDAMHGIEKEAWEAVPDATVVTNNPLLKGEDPLKKALDDVLSEGEPDPGKLPPIWATAAIEKFHERGSVPAKEVQALRSSLLDDAREAGGKGQKNLARRLNILANGALETLNLAESAFPEKLQKARSISREFNERFSNDVIAPILGKSARGGDKVAINETMERLFRPAEKGRTNMIALKAAMEGQMPSEAKSYVLQRFHAKAMPDGAINTGKAEDFLESYRPALEEVGLVDTISSYIQHGKHVDDAELALNTLHNSTAKDVAAKALKGDKSDGNQLVASLTGMFNHKTGPINDQVSDLFRTATEIQAKEGLKTAIAEAAIKSLYTQGGEVTSYAPDRVKRLVKALQITGEYTDEQIESFSQVADVAYRQMRAGKAQVFKGQSNTTQDTMRATVLSNLLQTAMLHASSAIKPSGPAALKFASMMSNFGKQIGVKLTGESAQNLINRAIFDKELMIALMENPNTVSEVSRSKIRSAAKAVTKYLVGGTAQPSQAQIYGEMLEDDNGN